MKKELITPEMASKILSTNTKANRKINAMRVEQLAEEIRNGLWKDNGETIKLSKKGKLLDGQHRLSAIALSKKPISLYIIRDIDDDAFDSIDTGKPRSVSDVLYVNGHKNEFNLAGALRVVAGFNKRNHMVFVKVGNTHRNLNSTWWKPRLTSSTECLKLLKNNPGIADSANMSASLRTATTLLTPSLVGALHWIFSNSGLPNAKDKANEYMQTLNNGEFKSKQNPVFIMREYLMRKKLKLKFRMSTKEKVSIAIWAWNNFIEGKPVKQYKESSDVPEIIGYNYTAAKSGKKPKGGK